jgi:PadR family transcriptional regulator PadR
MIERLSPEFKMLICFNQLEYILTKFVITFKVLKEITMNETRLTQTEEEILLTIWDLKEEAYLVAIRSRLNRIMEKDLTIGAVHIPLSKLEKEGLMTSRFGEATPKRGGRRKRIYRLTAAGIAVLKKRMKQKDRLWKSFSESQSY